MYELSTLNPPRYEHFAPSPYPVNKIEDFKPLNPLTPIHICKKIKKFRQELIFCHNFALEQLSLLWYEYVQKV